MHVFSNRNLTPLQLKLQLCSQTTTFCEDKLIAMLLDYAEELPPPNFGENAEATFLTEAKRWGNHEEICHEMLGNIYMELVVMMAVGR